MAARVFYAFVMASCTLLAAQHPVVFAVYTYGILYVAFMEWYAMNVIATEKKNWLPHKLGYSALAVMQQCLLNLDYVHLLALFTIVWVTDIAALAFGKLAGGPKLFPSVSPNKTVAGFCFGITSGALAYYAYATCVLANGYPEPYSVRQAIVLATIAQLSDLTESACKRQAGIKDSNLPGLAIPGHGGILDRIDALLFTAPVALLLTS